MAPVKSRAPRLSERTKAFSGPRTARAMVRPPAMLSLLEATGPPVCVRKRTARPPHRPLTQQRPRSPGIPAPVAPVCTVVVRWSPGRTAQILALRDELTTREFDEPDLWWPQWPDVVGGRDRVAGGTWCATDVRTGTTALVL